MCRKIFALLLLCSVTLHATVNLRNNIEKYEHFTLEYLYDEDSVLAIEEIEQREFPDLLPSQFTKGYRSGTAWFKIDLINQSINEDFVLYFTEPFWSSFDLYVKKNGAWDIQKNGLDILLNNRSIQDNNPAFKMHIPSNESRTFYVKGTTLSGHIGAFEVFTSKEYFRPSRISITNMYIIYGFILFSIVLLNVYSFIVMKERVYAYYIAYILSFIVFTSMKSASYLSLGFAGWSEGLHVVGTFIMVFLALFSGAFLELKQRMPFINKIFKLTVLVFLLFAVLISLNVPYSSLLFNIYGSFFITLLLVVAVKVWLQGAISARYYLIALMIYMPAMALMTLTFNGLLENTNISRYAFLGGAFIEIVFFTLILANRYKDMNREKIRIKDERLKEKERNQILLEYEIEKRTNDLLITNENLLKQTEELERTRDQLTVEATTDSLSTLYNRRYFTKISEQSFHMAKRYHDNLSIIMLDIDDFKSINDTYGHMVGDQVIKSCADVLKRIARESDVVARFGGEEFIVLLPKTDEEEALQLAERIRTNIQAIKLCCEEGREFDVTLSAGVSQIDDAKDEKIEEIIKRADKALYKAKSEGKNKVQSDYII